MPFGIDGLLDILPQILAQSFEPLELWFIDQSTQRRLLWLPDKKYLIESFGFPTDLRPIITTQHF